MALDAGCPKKYSSPPGFLFPIANIARPNRVACQGDRKPGPRARRKIAIDHGILRARGSARPPMFVRYSGKPPSALFGTHESARCRGRA